MKLVVCESCEAEFSIKHSMDDYYYRVIYCTFCGTELVDELENVITSTGRERLRVRERLISAWDSTLLTSMELDGTLQALEKGSITLQEAVDRIREEG